MTYKAAPITRMNKESEQVVVIGFSGARVGMSPFQQNILRHILKGKTGEFHHGDCIGSDAEAHDIVRSFTDKWRIVIHPPVNNALRAFKFGDEVRKPLPYLDRNRNIVDECNVFLATPKSQDTIGGTWYTVNYFRTVLEREFGRNLPPRTGSVILPDGKIGNIIASKK